MGPPRASVIRLCFTINEIAVANWSCLWNWLPLYLISKTEMPTEFHICIQQLSWSDSAHSMRQNGRGSCELMGTSALEEFLLVASPSPPLHSVPKLRGFLIIQRAHVDGITVALIFTGILTYRVSSSIMAPGRYITNYPWYLLGS